MGMQLESAPRVQAEAVCGKYLTFALGQEEYGLAILKVREIIGYIPVTPVPRMPAHVRGVVNLRGKVIPVLDLRSEFGMPAAELSEFTCIIVVEVGGEAGVISTGVMVDQVREVLDVAADQIEEPPQFGCGVETDFLLGMAKVGDSIKMLLDIDRILRVEELEGLGQG